MESNNVNYRRRIDEYADYREKWDSYPKKFVQDPVPIHLDLELTTYCNLDCDFCPKSHINLKPEHMPLELAKQIIDEFAKEGGLSIKFVYLGEPPLYPYLSEVIKYAKDKGIIDTIISTNGNFPPNFDFKKLVKSGLDFVIFSIDSIHPRTYREIRKGGCLSDVIKNLVVLRYVRDKLGRKTPEIQIQAIPFSNYNQMELLLNYYQEFYKPFADVIRIAPYCNDYQNDEIIGETPNFSCTSVFRRMTVRVNGDISLCCGSRIDSKVIGNVKDMSLEEAWNSKFFKNVREKMKEGNSHLIEACKTCPGRMYEETVD